MSTTPMPNYWAQEVTEQSRANTEAQIRMKELMQQHIFENQQQQQRLDWSKNNMTANESAENARRQQEFDLNKQKLGADQEAAGNFIRLTKSPDGRWRDQEPVDTSTPATAAPQGPIKPVSQTPVAPAQTGIVSQATALSPAPQDFFNPPPPPSNSSSVPLMLFGQPNGSLQPTGATASQGQTGALGQAAVGSVNPSQTAAGQTGKDSGPSAAAGMPKQAGAPTDDPGYEKPDVDLGGNLQYRIATPDERIARQAHIAKVQADAARTLSNQQLDDNLKTIQLNDPEGYKANKDEIDRAVVAKKLGVTLPDETKGTTQAKYLRMAADAYFAGNKALGDSYKSLSEDKPQLNDFNTFAPAYKASHPNADGVEISRAYNDQKAQINSQYSKPGTDKQVIFTKRNPDGTTSVKSIGDGETAPPGYEPQSVANTQDNAKIKSDAAAAKGYKDADDAFKRAQGYAKLQTGFGDAALLQEMIGRVKPESIGKIRFNQSEINWQGNAVSPQDKVLAMMENLKNRSGAKLDPHTRQQVLDVMRTERDSLQAPAGPTNDDPAGIAGSLPPR